MKLIGCLGFSNLLLLFSGCPHPFSHYFLLTFSVKLHAKKIYRELEESQKKRYSSGIKRHYAGVRNKKRTCLRKTQVAKLAEIREGKGETKKL